MDNKVDEDIKIIGEKYFPVNEISEESYREKLGGRSELVTLHYWWTRKPLIASRSAILASSISSDTDHDFFKEKILGLYGTLKSREIAQRQDVSKNLEFLKSEYKKVFGKEKPLLLDPFAGGGSIPYEALRLGFDVIANDYNPVAWLIMKTTLEFPKLYGKQLLEIVSESYKLLRSTLLNEMKEYYSNSPHISEGWEPVTYIYSWAVSCPHCSMISPMVNNWRVHDNKRTNDFSLAYIVPKINNGDLEFEMIKKEGPISQYKESKKDIPEGTNKRGKGTCINCKNTISNEHILKDLSQNSKEMLLAVVDVNTNEQGNTYRLPTNEELSIFNEFNDIIKNIDIQNFIPNERMPEGVIRSARYLETWDRLFNPRQKLFFALFVKNAIQITSNYDRDLQKVVASYFTILLGKLINRNCRCTSWILSWGGIAHALQFRSLPIVWDHCEVQPFASSGSGTWDNTVEYIISSIERFSNDLYDTPGNINIKMESALSLSQKNEVDIICTDPPYGDDVPYSEVSEFFYSWGKIILKNFFEKFETMPHPPREEDLSSNKKDRDQEYIQLGWLQSFSNLYNLIKQGGYLSLFFAHGSLETWSFVINSLHKAGFIIKSTYPIHTESPYNPIAKFKASFFTSILILAEKVDRINGVVYLDELEEDIEIRTKRKVLEYWKDGLRGSDLTMAVLGPILEVITSYKNIKSMTGEIDISEILALATKYLINNVLEILNADIPNIDNKSALLFYLRLNGMFEIAHDSLQILTKSKGVAKNEFLNNKLLTRKKSGSNTLYKINTFEKRPNIEDPIFLIDILHMAMKKFEKGGTEAFWKYIDEQSYDRPTVEKGLQVIGQGGSNVKGSKLNVILDEDVHLAREILSIEGIEEKLGETTLDNWF